MHIPIFLASEPTTLLGGGVLMMLGSLAYTIQGIRKNGGWRSLFKRVPWQAIIVLGVLCYSAFLLQKAQPKRWPKAALTPPAHTNGERYFRTNQWFQCQISTNAAGRAITNEVLIHMPRMSSVNMLGYQVLTNGPQWLDCQQSNVPICWFSNDDNCTEWVSRFNASSNRIDRPR